MKNHFGSRAPMTAIGLGAMLLPGFTYAETKTALVQAPVFNNFQKVVDPVSGGDPVHVTLSLSGFQKDLADKFVEELSDPNSPNYRHWITTTEFGNRFGASDNDVQAIRDYLASQGFQNINIAAAKNFVSATGTIDQAAAAFHTSFARFVRPPELVAKGQPETLFAPKEPVSLPENLAAKVNGVSGLDNLAIPHSNLTKGKAAARKQAISGLIPSQLSKAYDNAPYVNSHPGHDMKIAVWSPTARYTNDPIDFANRLGISQNFTISDIFLDGGNSGLGGADEAAVDSETILGQANHAQIYMVTAPGNEEVDGFDWVGKQNNIPILSSSWAGYESEYIVNGKVTAFPAVFESTCESLAAAGITIFIASGDSAWFGGSGVQSVEMEASCPYVTSVGGTQLTVNSNDTWNSETLWAYNGNRSNPQGGGGGESQIFKRPSWQTFVGPSNSFVDGFRMMPDVSANASNIGNHIYYAVVKGVNTTRGGTSLATPLWASNLLLMEQNWGNDGAKAERLGCINPTIYTLGNDYENSNADYTFNTIFHDITSGSNGHFNTTAGFDLCSGWGSPNFGRLWADVSYLGGFNSLSPDLRPASPSGWSHPLVIQAAASSAAEPTSFEHGVKYYFGAGSQNIGTADAPVYPFKVTVDGAVAFTENFKSTPINSTIQWMDFGSYTFTKGNHTIVYTVNAGGKIKESNQSNNTYTRTITVK